MTQAARLHRGQLFRKYFLLILALVCGTLLISGGIGLYFAYQENKVSLASLQREKAAGAAARIEQFVREIEQHVAAAALPQLGTEGLEQRRLEFLKLLRMVDRVTDIVQLDSKGREQIFESRLGMSSVGSMKDHSQSPAFKNARPGQTWFGPVYFRKETEPYMQIAVRAGGESGAVTVADVNLKFMWDVITRIRVGQKGKAYVVDGAGYLIADPDIGLVLRKTDLSGLEQVKAALAPGADDSLALQAKDLAGHSVLTAFAPIEPARENPQKGLQPSPLGWKVFVEQPVSEVYSALDATIYRTIALIVAGLLFSALAALWLARSMVRPINTLQEGAQRIGAGDLDQKIDVRTGDELQALAEQFNRMTEQLRESYSGLERKVTERTAELQQTLEQQTATSEILRVISSSTSDTKPVFDAIVKNAAALCDGMFANAILYDGEMLHFVATNNTIPAALEVARKLYPMRPDRSQVSGRVILTKSMVRMEDARADSDYDQRHSVAGGWRRMLGVPMLREGNPIGAIVVGWADPGPISGVHEELLKTFADQAVIAIENVRLFNETKESLEQQTATSEILRVISDSPGDVKPILDSVADRATRLCDATATAIYVVEGETLRRTAFHGPEELAGRDTLPYVPSTLTGRAIAEGKPIHIEDLERVQAEFPITWDRAQRHGRRQTMLAVPLMREGRPFGAMFLRRTEVRPFGERQIALSKIFADQAAIGIENVRLFREIREKSAQLEIANKHKSDFLANMSHELRTPLNAIIGFSEVLMDKMFGELNAKQADYLKDIHDSGRHLLSLINDILDLSKIEAGRMDLEISSFDLPGALSNAMTLVRERAQRHSIGLSLEVDKSLGTFRADERKFKQIVVNLLSNAVKFTPDGGSVAVSAKKDTTCVEIAVKDTGIGIAPEDHAAVFEEFKQVGRDYTKKAEGTGLGLTLTKRFVELHGGEIRLQSDLGKGSTFTVTLPLRQ